MFAFVKPSSCAVAAQALRALLARHAAADWASDLRCGGGAGWRLAEARLVRRRAGAGGPQLATHMAMGLAAELESGSGFGSGSGSGSGGAAAAASSAMRLATALSLAGSWAAEAQVDMGAAGGVMGLMGRAADIALGALPAAAEATAAAGGGAAGAVADGWEAAAGCRVLYRLAAYADGRYREVVAALTSPEHVRAMEVVAAKRREAEQLTQKSGELLCGLVAVSIWDMERDGGSFGGARCGKFRACHCGCECTGLRRPHLRCPDICLTRSALTTAARMLHDNSHASSLPPAAPPPSTPAFRLPLTPALARALRGVHGSDQGLPPEAGRAGPAAGGGEAGGGRGRAGGREGKGGSGRACWRVLRVAWGPPYLVCTLAQPSTHQVPSVLPGRLDTSMSACPPPGMPLGLGLGHRF
mgnify:CR=1 FL=1